MYRIELRAAPRRLSNLRPDETPQEVEQRNDLTVMLKYSKSQGGKLYEVHRYPDVIANEMNRYNHPYAMSENELYEFSGLSPLNFW